MATIDELSFGAKLGIVVLVMAVIGGAGYYLFLNNLYAETRQVNEQVTAKKQENDRLRTYEPRLAELTAQLNTLQQEMANQRLIVPDEKEADKYIKLLHDTAGAAGVEIRRYTANPAVNREFYTEVPFQLDIDGPYYSVLNFFDRVAKLTRIVTVTNLQMTNTKNTSPSKVKTTYTYAPGETVVASCIATTYFSHEQALAPAPEAPKK